MPLDDGGDHFGAPIPTDGESDPPAVEELPSDAFVVRQLGRGSRERLIDRITDPTAWLMDLRYRQHWNWPVDATDPDTQALQFRPTIPFLAWDQVNILRVTVPYDLAGPDGAGLGDVQLFDLIVFEADWGRWGIGPSLRLKPSSDTDGDTFQAGPAGGAVSKTKHWTLGVLTQNFLADTDSETRIQPILAYKFDDQWALGIGESEFRYDWESSMWTQLPLGLEVDYIADFSGQKIQFFVNPQYNFQRDASNSGWTVFVGLTLLVPDA